MFNKIKWIKKFSLFVLLGCFFNNFIYDNNFFVLQKKQTKNNNYHLLSDTQIMGEITVNVEGSKIVGYVEGQGSLSVSSTITEISSSSFNKNTNISLLDLSQATSLLSIVYYAFNSCENLIGDLIIPKNLKIIGTNAFCSTKINKLDLSNALSLERIENSAFYKSDLSNDLLIPENLKYIGYRSFSGANITSINLSKNHSLETIGSHAFSNCLNLLGNLVFPSTLNLIGSWAFSDCTNLTGDLVIPSKVTSIRDGAFFNTSITSLDLSQATSLTTIGISSFENCSSLTGEILIPNNCTKICSNAFNSTNITFLDLSNAHNLKTIGTSAFANCKNMSGDLCFPSSLSEIKGYSFNGSPVDNIFFTSETPPAFEHNWQPTVTGKVYVPSEEAKQTYLNAPNFGFEENQVEVIVNKANNKTLILSLSIGLSFFVLIVILIWLIFKKKNKK